MTAPATAETKLPSIENVLIRGDLSQLTEAQRLEYYQKVCQSVGINPLTRPFEYLTLNGKLQLYARKDATDQLRKLHGISVEIVTQEESAEDGLFMVHARAKAPDGRTDEDYGVVSMGKLAGDFKANMILKCVTKAKRRVTLSICGLGWLDETEVEDIPEEAKAAPKKKLKEPETGPNMTRADAIALSSKLLRAIQQAETKEAKQLAQDMCADEMRRMHRDQTEVYDRLIIAIDREMAELE